MTRCFSIIDSGFCYFGCKSLANHYPIPWSHRLVLVMRRSQNLDLLGTKRHAGLYHVVDASESESEMFDFTCSLEKAPQHLRRCIPGENLSLATDDMAFDEPVQ